MRINNDYRHGEIKGIGPNFAEAMARFKQRQIEAGKVGKWRYQNESWKTDNGEYIDRDWDIIDY